VVDVGSGGRRGEELQGDVVRVLERQAGPVARVGDLAMLDAQLLQVALPLLQFATVGGGERDLGGELA
jgi:hypothetical protein